MTETTAILILLILLVIICIAHAWLLWRYIHRQQEKQRPGHLQAIAQEDAIAVITDLVLKDHAHMLYTRSRLQNLDEIVKAARNGRYDPDRPNGVNDAIELVHKLEDFIQQHS